jgi:hypothetical protein
VLHRLPPQPVIASLHPIPEPRPVLTIDQIDKLFPTMRYKEWKSSLSETPNPAAQDGLVQHPTVGNLTSLHNPPRVENLGDRKPVNHRPSVARPAPLNYKSRYYSSRQVRATGTNCAICLDLLKDKDTVRGLPCNHCYHPKCIDPWLTDRRGSCPLCKRSYVPLEEIQQSHEYLARRSVILPSPPASTYLEHGSRPSRITRMQNRITRLFFGERPNHTSQVDLDELERGRS